MILKGHLFFSSQLTGLLFLTYHSRFIFVRSSDRTANTSTVIIYHFPTRKNPLSYPSNHNYHHQPGILSLPLFYHFNIQYKVILYHAKPATDDLISLVFPLLTFSFTNWTYNTYLN